MVEPFTAVDVIERADGRSVAYTEMLNPGGTCVNQETDTNTAAAAAAAVRLAAITLVGCSHPLPEVLPK